MLRMDQIHVIRHKLHVEKKSLRQVAHELGMSRNTVRKYADLPQPEPLPRAPRARPVHELVQPRIAELHREWSSRTTSKQRITGTRLHRQLRQEGYDVGITLVRQCLRELTQHQIEVFIPLEHHPGDEGQVDFFEVTVEIDGERRKAWLFVLRLMFSGRDFIWLYERCDQLSFFDGHVRAFEHLGGVPQRLVYDNLKAAVRKVVLPERELTRRFIALHKHYLFEPCFARPYTGHDKGGVEARGKGIRLTHFVPIPRGSHLDAIAETVLLEIDADAQTERRHRDHEPTIAELFERERPLLLELPGQLFEARHYVATQASSSSLVKLEGAYYSVPTSWARRDIDAWIGLEHVELACQGERLIRPRGAFGERVIRYVEDYLPELARKPQAVRQLAARLVEELGAPFDELWQLLVDRHGPRDAARHFARVLGAVASHGLEPMRARVAQTLARGELDVLPLPGAEAPARAPDCVPEALREIEVEQARAADFDVLLERGGES